MQSKQIKDWIAIIIDVNNETMWSKITNQLSRSMGGKVMFTAR